MDTLDLMCIISMLTFVITIMQLYLFCVFCDGIIENIDNFYKIIVLLPMIIVIGPIYLLVKSSPIQKLHKFLLTNPRDYIKFRIKIERK